MGSIISKIEEIDRIRWTQPRKGRVMKASRVLFTDETTAIIELASGAYTVAGHRHSPNGNWAVMGYGLDRFGGAILDGLVRLGILTKEQVSAHKKASAEARKKYDAAWRKKAIREHCAELGIPVPKEAA